ncbi:MAG: tRNA (adenosine(37)-N6)-dimethylallyltransferase MiaA [Treponema sp.]|nr:tRNA (adenosine(37)-N6)-dimethylallyltransferase MiaA [Treponema sp.]
MPVPVIILFAPTASGKTALALNLFGKSSPSFFKGRAELISADSMQVYKGLDIGTAKPSDEEKSELPHHLIDILDPSVQFSVADFVSGADSLCSEIYSRSKIPLVAGGTGFYVRSFILGLPKTPESDPIVRDMLNLRLRKEGNEVLYEELCRIDPVSAGKINVNDAYRICRALEIFYTTGKPKSFFEMNLSPRKEYDFCVIILDRNRDELYERINRRVDIMFDSGLEEEVRSLISSGCTADMPGMQAIGYREWFGRDFSTVDGLEKIRSEIKRNSRKYAKKQFTFMHDIPNAHVIHLGKDEDGVKQVSEIIFNFLNKSLDRNAYLDNN